MTFRLLLFERVFSLIGRSVGTHPRHYLFASLFVSISLTIGLSIASLNDDIRLGYTDSQSASAVERVAFRRFIGTDRPLYSITIVGLSLDGGSMVRETHLSEFLAKIRFVTNEFTTNFDGHKFSLANVTNHARSSSTMLDAFLNGVKIQNSRLAAGLAPDSNIVLDYPISTFHSRKMPMTNVFFGVKNASSSATRQAFTMHVWLIDLWLLLEPTSEQQLQAIKIIELRLVDLLTDRSFSPLVQFEIYGDEIVNREVLRGAVGSISYFLAGFFLMTVFVVVTVIDWHRGPSALTGASLSLVGATIMAPLLAAGAVLGLLSVCGRPINSLMCLMPFLLLGIGVDDAFLLIHGWRRLAVRHLSSAEKLSRTLVSVGPSVTITSLTNTMAFSVGAFSATPQVRAFCLCTALALSADFVLFFVLFAAVVVLVDESIEEEKTAAIPSIVIRCSRWLTGTPVRMLAILLLISLWTVSAIGLFRMSPDFSAEKTFQGRSRLVNSLSIVDDMFFDHENTMIIVNRPPQLTNSSDLALFRSCSNRLLSLPTSCPGNALDLWLDDYEQYQRFDHFNSVFFGLSTSRFQLDYNNVPIFLESQPTYRPLVHWSTFANDSTIHVDSFAMSLCSRGALSWYDRAVNLETIRELLEECNHFEMTAFSFDSSIFDLILSTEEVTLRSVIITSISMAFICFMFIPGFGVVFIATVTIASITLGMQLLIYFGGLQKKSPTRVELPAVVGFLSWWNCDLDIIVMVDMLMAVGLTVDFTAHICFHYTVHSTCRQYRLETALDAIAWPMLQAGLSTCISVLPLLLFDVYSYRTFVKTITLTVGFGLLHGLVFLPVGLASLPNCCVPKRPMKNEISNVRSSLILPESEAPIIS